MKALFIGGKGNLSTACSRLAPDKGIDLYILNRGNRKRPELKGAVSLNRGINDAKKYQEHLKGEFFDVVVNFIAFSPGEIERDIKLFSGNRRRN